MTTDTAAVVAERVVRVHRDGPHQRRSLDDVSLQVTAGEVVAVMGPSGSGKTSLLHLLAGLDQPDEGAVCIDGTDWRGLRGSARAQFRRRHCGLIVQGAGLLPQATAAENVEVPLLLEGMDPRARQQRVHNALAAVGLTAEAAKLPDQLSGGQQQRVAIARALVAEPAVVLADEPTGSLDSATASSVATLLVDNARNRRAAVVLVTHDPAIARLADRLVVLRSGRIDDDPTEGR